MEYEVTVEIDTKGLESIYGAKQCVTFVKEVVQQANALTNNLASSNYPPVTWLSFQPLGKNAVKWTEDYYIYATTMESKSGKIVEVNAITSAPAQMGWTYTFASGMFTGASGGVPDAFGIYNATQTPNFCFGLAQQATINDNAQPTSPLNAIPVLYNQQAHFATEERISIFLSSCDANGTIIFSVPDNALTIALTRNDPTANVGFNDSNNTFYILG